MIYAIYLVLRALLCFQLILISNTPVVWIIVAFIVFYDMVNIFLVGEDTLSADERAKFEAQMRQAEADGADKVASFYRHALSKPKETGFIARSIGNAIVNILIFVLV